MGSEIFLMSITMCLIMVSSINQPNHSAMAQVYTDRNKNHFTEDMKDMPPNVEEVCHGDYEHKYEHVIYIDSSRRQDSYDDCNPWQFLKQASITCPDMNAALHFHANSVAYVLRSGGNITHYLKQDVSNSVTFFEDLSDVGFFGSNDSEPAHVECLPEAGLAFWNVNNVRIQSVVLSFCGVLRNTTSKNFTNSEHFSLTQTKVGMFFYNGTNVSMCRVTVQHGVNTVGVTMYDTTGRVDVYYSNFENNTISNLRSTPGGGGVYR